MKKFIAMVLLFAILFSNFVTLAMVCEDKQVIENEEEYVPQQEEINVSTNLDDINLDNITDANVEMEVTETITENDDAEVEIEDSEKNNFQEYSLPNNSGFKSYMSYKAITSKSSLQYKLQSQYAYTGDYGIRQVNNRFCVAIGTFSDAKVGTYIDLVLENGNVIPCIVGDFKANNHTDSNNMVTKHNGCVSEFIVDRSALHTTAKKMGDISYCREEWKSSVKTVIVYQTNVFDL